MDTQIEYIDTKEYYSTLKSRDLLIHAITWMDLKIIIQSQRRQAK